MLLSSHHVAVTRNQTTTKFSSSNHNINTHRKCDTTEKKNYLSTLNCKAQTPRKLDQAGEEFSKEEGSIVQGYKNTPGSTRTSTKSRPGLRAATETASNAPYPSPNIYMGLPLRSNDSSLMVFSINRIKSAQKIESHTTTLN
jgi:hypothetical protein